MAVEVVEAGVADDPIILARGYYDHTLPYHNLDYANRMVANIDSLSARVESRGIHLAKEALRIAAAWQIAGYHEDYTERGFSQEEYAAHLAGVALQGVVDDETLGTVNSIIISGRPGFDRTSDPNHAVFRWAGFGDFRYYYKFKSIQAKAWHEKSLQDPYGDLTWPEYEAILTQGMAVVLDEARRELPTIGEPCINDPNNFMALDVLIRSNLRRLAGDSPPHKIGWEAA